MPEGTTFASFLRRAGGNGGGAFYPAHGGVLFIKELIFVMDMRPVMGDNRSIRFEILPLIYKEEE